MNCEAALLHDLGKSKIDPAIVNKDGKLTDKEFTEMKKHPELGYAIGLKLGIKTDKYSKESDFIMKKWTEPVIHLG